jgi:hypothetical protein
MTQVLSLSYRPKTFSQMVGAGKLIKKIRSHYEDGGREPAAFLFDGHTGAGKTTLMRIIALALQCEHQEKFGNPCLECRQNRRKFDIIEPTINKVDELKQALSGVNYHPRYGRRRVYILDEVQRFTGEAQDFLLSVLENSPPTTKFLLATTRPDKVIETIQRRCMCYTVPALELEDVRKLVNKAFAHLQVDKDADELTEALLEANVSSPGLVVVAIEKYLAGASATEAVLMANSDVDVHAICRAVIRGHWPDVVKHLKTCPPDTARAVRVAVSRYLMKILWGDVEFSDRGDVVKNAILELARMGQLEDKVQLAGLSAVLYNVAHKFKFHSR